eukprot:gene27069-59963_t
MLFPNFDDFDNAVLERLRSLLICAHLPPCPKCGTTWMQQVLMLLLAGRQGAPN